MEFQQACIERLSQVLKKHKKEGSFEHQVNGLVRFTVVFDFEGRTYEIGIYKETVTMWEGRSLFECYMPEEFESEPALIDGFATRLDRYLSGGPWEGPAEKGLPDLIKENVKRLFRR